MNKMSTTQADIRRWIKAAQKNKATHLLVCTDRFDYTDYPVEVKAGEDARKIYEEHNGPNMQKVMEVYNLYMDIEEQLSDPRAFNIESKLEWKKFEEPFLNKKHE